MLAIKAVVKDGLIKPLEAVDLPEDKEIVIYIPEEKVEEEYSDWTDEEWQRFSLHSFMNTEDDKDIDWEDFFNVKEKRIKHQEETGFAKKVLGNV
jgi:predicted DNA-binding antitoxin AbrB/MazE fold protein